MKVPEPDSPSDPNVDQIPFVTEGVGAGFVGAAVVALYFGVLDLVDGRPLFTPFALGARLFLGAFPETSAPAQPQLVLGYTLLHLCVFVSFGYLASFLLVGRRIPTWTFAGRMTALTVALFLACQGAFLVFAMAVAPGALEVVGAWRVAVANLLGALAMSAILASHILRDLWRPRMELARR